ncbi:hypothetical protein SLEP1_g31852 [Rubroshorea leprosula]|uniref:Uncharacterized protein n=1 Tax=Rubroshorea leprosula TaxID=152421 RepID=A0AAV5KBI1_9ROSI|nr:hypothetical protein SLEP1_g31852 [Rubroshorea leprosula]
MGSVVANSGGAAPLLSTAEPTARANAVVQLQPQLPVAVVV